MVLISATFNLATSANAVIFAIFNLASAVTCENNNTRYDWPIASIILRLCLEYTRCIHVIKLFKKEIKMHIFIFKAASRGYHKYMDGWQPKVNEQLSVSDCGD